VKLFSKPGLAVIPVDRSTIPPKNLIAISTVSVAIGLNEAMAFPDIFAEAEHVGVQAEVAGFDSLRSRWTFPSANLIPRSVMMSTASEADRFCGNEEF